MPNDSRHDELIDLAFAVCDGTATDDQITAVEELILGDPAARLLYLQCMEMHFEMNYQAVDVEVLDSPLAATQFSLTPLPALSTTHYPLPASFVGGPVFSYMVASIILCAMLLGAWAYKITHLTQTPCDSRHIAGNDHERSESIYVGRVTGMKDCRWANEGESTIIGALVLLDREYALSSGLMEITYKNGAKVILEGPCEYKVDSLAGGYLAVGKLTARVRTKGSGFKVQGSEHSPLSTLHSPLFAVRTPTAVITDLGTEFGVEVDENGDTVSCVFQGSIKVQGLSASADSGTVLHANESIRVSRVRETHQDSDKAETVRFTHPTTPPEFIRRMPSLREANKYTSVVLADEPLFYWTFNEPAGAAIEQVRRSPPHSLYPRGGAKRCKHSAIGSGLALGRAADFSQAAGAFASGRLGYQDRLHGPWAIELWIQPTGKQNDRTGQYVLNNGLYAAVPRYANTNPAIIFDWPEDAEKNELQLFNQYYSGPTHGGPILGDSQWRHVIMAFYGSNSGYGVAPRVDVVVNGERKTIEHGKFSSGFRLDGQLWIGAEGDELEHPFHGRIDELAFYDFDGLTERQIENRTTDMGRRHYDAALKEGGKTE